MAEDLILPLLGYNGDDEEDDTTDSDEGIDNNDNNEDESEDNHSNGRQRVEYDTTLPSQHNYLGQVFDELSGRVVLDETSFVSMPLLTLPGIVLVPGQVLPLQLYHPSVVSMMKKLIEGQRTVGITTSFDPTLGTTAEIRSYSEDNDENGEGLPVLKVKAEGRQRFTVKESWRQDGVLMGKVEILPEYELTHPLRIPTYKHIDRTLSACSRWPKWVYQLYDPNLLMDKIKIHLKNWCPISTNNTLYPSQAPSKPCEFSYWVASNLPLDDSLRCQLLAINSSIQRLRWELSLLEKYSYLCCAECKTKICNKDDVIVMSIHGPQGTYVNAAGHVHEMISVNRTYNIALIGRASTDFTWFPGYAWTICRCTRCNSHMGWKYSSVNKKLKPEWFWGLTRSSLEPGLKIEDDVSWKPVF